MSRESAHWPAILQGTLENVMKKMMDMLAGVLSSMPAGSVRKARKQPARMIVSPAEEIAAHNAAVVQRKAAKKARALRVKMSRKAAKGEAL